MRELRRHPVEERDLKRVMNRSTIIKQRILDETADQRFLEGLCI